MTRAAILVAAALGLAAIARAAIYYAGVDRLALGLVLAMAAALGAGVVELLARVQRAGALRDELRRLPVPATEASIAAASPTLRRALRARLDPSPGNANAAGIAFAPYLVGLLVMLGLLGTFLGLFETLRGARQALTTSADVDALREGLAGPMQGLTRSFGTSAAGVSASACLGLAVVFARRAEARFFGALAAYASGALSRLTLQARQVTALESLVLQGEALPRAAAILGEAVTRLSELEVSWRASHAEAARETARALKEAASDVRADLSTAIARVAAATHDAALPLVERAVSASVAAARAHADAVRAGLEADRASRRAEDAQHASRLEAHLGLLAGAEEARAASLDARWAYLTTGLESNARALKCELAAAVEAGRVQLASRGADDAARGRELGALVLRIDQMAASVAASTEKQSGAAASLLALVDARARDAAASARADAEAVANHVRDAVVAQASSLSRFEAEIARAHQAASTDVATALTTHASELDARLAETAARVSHAAELLSAGGGELGAVADAFSAAVARHQEAASRWLEELGRVEDAVERAGEGAAASALGETLARLEEVFDRQLRVQLELFTQLRAPRTLSGGDDTHGDDTEQGASDAPA